LIEPERLLLLQSDSKILAMASYNTGIFGGTDSLIVEGISMAPEIQGTGVFARMTKEVLKDSERYVCLRTQNPCMYQALVDMLGMNVHPCGVELPESFRQAREDFARHLGCKADKNGVVKGHYGGLFYGEEPRHAKVDPLFREIGMDLHNGDALLVIGTRDLGNN
jgi:hypothetical protein